MYSFEGDFRRKPLQSLRGASKKEEKDALLQRAQIERQKRETQRKKLESSLKIQSWFRGCRTRKKQASYFRQVFDEHVQKLQHSSNVDLCELNLLTSHLLYFYNNQSDGQRLTWLCQQILKHREKYIPMSEQVEHRVTAILALCLRYLESIAAYSTPIAVPMRMLEIFTSPETFKVRTEKNKSSSTEYRVYSFLVNKGYFDCLRCLLNEKVPSSIDKTTSPPTPVAASIFDLIMRPIYFAASCSDKKLSQLVLTAVCKSLLCPAYTEQVGQFLLPAMAYGKYPFPVVELIQALITECGIDQSEGMSPSEREPIKQRSGQSLTPTPWLLCAFLTLGEKELTKFTDLNMLKYLGILKRLIWELPGPKVTFSSLEDSDSEEEDMAVDEQAGSYSTIEELREECLRLLDTPEQVKVILTCVVRFPDPSTYTAVCTICHALLIQQRLHVHKTRLLYTLAFNANFIKHLWNSCLSVYTLSVTGSQTPLLQMLSSGLEMSQKDIERIIPMLSVFCSLFSHSLLTLHDAEFYAGFTGSSTSSMPFDVVELAPMCQALRDACLGIIQLAHPDSKPVVHEDYRAALQRTGIRTRQERTEAEEKQTLTWAYLFKVIAHLVRQLYKRNTRRPFCPPNHWLAPHVSIRAERPAQLHRAQREMFVRRPLGALRLLAQTKVEDEGPPLSNKEIRNLVILTEFPFVVGFQERVKVLQRLINKDKEEHQNDMTHFLSGPAITVLIRRNYVYEDAYEKLSKENEPNLKLKMRIQLVNAAGLDEAGIDGGGIFREFLSQLLKTAFDPNRGFFKYTTDRLLYPNPQAKVLNEDYQKHYYFVGRMLGKAVYENMLAELPFASFFLSKILSRHSGDLDIHHLASMDPEMYKNLMFLKSYDGDVIDLGLDFSILRNDFGEANLEDLKPGGRNIPVTNSNRIEYVHLMADYLLNKQIRQHCQAFREGMSDVIDLDWLRMFDHHELQVLISGASVPVNIDDLRQHTNYSGGYTADHDVIKLFWKVVEEFNDKQRRQLLKFVTSCSRPPLLGFKDLYPAFCVHYAGSEVERLPTASTCMNLLKLPEFKDLETMRNKLLYAVESESGFELS